MAQKDAWRAYVELALGLTETSRKKAMKIVQEVAGKGGATAEQLQELVTQGLANREAMTRMIRVELDRALGKVGLATMDEVEELNRRVRDLERELYAARVAAGLPTDTGVDGAAPAAAVAKKTVARKTTKAAPAKTTTSTAAKTTTAKTAAKAAPSATAKRAPAKTAATKSTAAKTTARKAPAKTAKSTAAKATGTGR